MYVGERRGDYSSLTGSFVHRIVSCAGDQGDGFTPNKPVAVNKT